MKSYQNYLAVVFAGVLMVVTLDVLAFSPKATETEWTSEDNSQWGLLIENAKVLREDYKAAEELLKGFGQPQSPFPEGRETELWKLFLSLPVRSNQDVTFFRSTIGRVPDRLLASIPQTLAVDLAFYNTTNRLLDIKGKFWTIAKRFELAKAITLRTEKADSLIQIGIYTNIMKNALIQGILTTSVENAMKAESLRSDIRDARTRINVNLPAGLEDRLTKGKALPSDYAAIRTLFNGDITETKALRRQLLEILGPVAPK